LSAAFKLLADLSVNVQSRLFVFNVLYQHPSTVEEAYFKAFVVEHYRKLRLYSHIEVVPDSLIDLAEVSFYPGLR